MSDTNFLLITDALIINHGELVLCHYFCLFVFFMNKFVYFFATMDISSHLMHYAGWFCV